MASTSAGCIGPPTREHQPQTSKTGLNKAQFGRLTEVVNSKWEVICQIVVKIPPYEEELLRKYEKVQWKGTGFVIGGNFVITNHHVLPKKVAKYAKAYFFQVFEENTVKTLVKIVRIELDWGRYYYASKDNKKKLSQFPKVRPLPLPADKEHLDFAIVALKQGKDEDLYLHSIQKNVFNIFTPVACENNPDDLVSILHHPGVFDSTTLIEGDVRWSSGTLRNICKYFVHYSRMATGGSSGGPLIDISGNLIALNYQTVLQCKEGCQSAAPSSSQEVSQDRKQVSCGCGPKDIVLPTDSGCCSGVRMDRIVDYLSSELKGVKQKDEIEKSMQEDRARYPKYLSEQLLDHYRKQNHNTYNIGYSLEGFDVENVNTNLAIIDDKEKEKKNERITFNDRRDHPHGRPNVNIVLVPPEKIFSNDTLDNAPKKRVVFFGVAGVGKTTLCEEAALQGTRWWPQFTTIFLIKLRNVNNQNYRNRSKDYSAYEILATECGVSLEYLEEALKSDSSRKQSLIILDGFDELPREAQIGCESGSLKNFLKDLMEKFDHLLITSRPGRVNIDTYCEYKIVGFDDEKVKEYINNFYKKLTKQGKISNDSVEVKINAFRRLLKRQPVLRSLVQIPINLTLACSIFYEEEAVLNSVGTISLTSFYLKTVNSFYRRFIKKSHVPETSSEGLDAPPLSDAAIQDIDKAFQLIAWTAMKNDIIQISEQTVTNVLRRNKKINKFNRVGFDNRKKIGLMKFENESWEFIHLTFQEYFAAVYIANFYLDGKTKEEKSRLLDKARKCLAAIKLNPRFALTLRMVTGYLAEKREKNLRKKRKEEDPLEIFFSHLFEKPSDLARSYQLGLLAQCFEECRNPEDISHYSTFMRECAELIRRAPSELVIMELLNRNIQLLKHQDIISAICDCIKDPYKLHRITNVLNNLIVSAQFIPLEIVRALEQVVQNRDLFRDCRRDAMWILECIIKKGGLISIETAKTLQETVTIGGLGGSSESLYELYIKNVIRGCGADYTKLDLENLFYYRDKSYIDVVFALEKMVRGCCVISEDVAKAFAITFQEDTVPLDFSNRKKAVQALGEIVKNEEIVSQKKLSYLEEILGVGEPEEVIDLSFSSNEHLTNPDAISSDQLVDHPLTNRLKNFLPGLRKRAIIALEKIAKGKDEVSKEAVNVLVAISQDITLEGSVIKGIVKVLSNLGVRKRMYIITRSPPLLSKEVCDVPVSSSSNVDCLEGSHVEGGESRTRTPCDVIRIEIEDRANCSQENEIRLTRVRNLSLSSRLEELFLDLSKLEEDEGSSEESLYYLVENILQITRPEDRKQVVERLLQMTKREEGDSRGIILVLMKMVRHPDLGADIRKIVIEISEDDGPSSKRVLKSLWNLFHVEGVDGDPKDPAFEIFVEIVKKGNVKSKWTIPVLMRLIRDPKLNKDEAKAVSHHLLKIAERNQADCDKIMLLLSATMKNVSIGKSVRRASLRVLGDIIRAIKTIPPEVESALEKIIQDGRAGVMFRRNVFAILIFLIETREKALPKEVIKAVLGDMPYRGDSDNSGPTEDVYSGMVLEGLEKLVPKKGGLSEDFMAAILEICEDEGRQSDHVDARERNSKSCAVALETLRRLSLKSLIKSVSNNESCNLVIRICFLTNRAVFIFDEMIHISDYRDQESIPIPPQVDVRELIDPLSTLDSCYRFPICSSSTDNPTTSSSISSDNRQQTEPVFPPGVGDPNRVGSTYLSARSSEEDSSSNSLICSSTPIRNSPSASWIRELFCRCRSIFR